MSNLRRLSDETLEKVAEIERQIEEWEKFGDKQKKYRKRGVGISADRIILIALKQYIDRHVEQTANHPETCDNPHTHHPRDTDHPTDDSSPEKDHSKVFDDIVNQWD